MEMTIDETTLGHAAEAQGHGQAADNRDGSIAGPELSPSASFKAYGSILRSRPTSLTVQFLCHALRLGQSVARRVEELCWVPASANRPTRRTNLSLELYLFPQQDAAVIPTRSNTCSITMAAPPSAMTSSPSWVNSSLGGCAL